ncbi:MAG: transglycosylase SLT domain-containing protein [Rhodoferax sp.]|nr:transglycosylase SLT domain-containing protein [Rhodoferax sp.]
MNAFIRILLLTCVVWVSGCASINPSSSATAQEQPDYALARSDAHRGDTEANAPGLHPPVYPSEGLRPLTGLELGSQPVHALTPPADIWERIRRGFAMPDLQDELVSEREQWYATRPDYVQRMTERGSKYLFYIVEEIERRRMPSELALLPFIESAFNPQAISSAKAAGMWQFMPATGRVFDLRQNMFRDDRRDVLASTRAALDYLEKLYAMFGDWQLALAAYNWGEGSVGRAIAKNQKAGLGTGYPDLKMPAETRLYVPKLQAVKNLVAAPQKFGLMLPDIGNHPYFQTVDIRHDIDVALAARLAEVSLDDFKALNPQLSRPVLLAAGTPQILLPWDNATIFDVNLQAYRGDQLASWTAWTAPKTLKPAEAAKRVGMSEAELREVNHIQGRMLISAGSTLLVRRSDNTSQDVSRHIANNASLHLAPEVSLRKVVVKAKKKDSIQALAKRYRVSADQVAQWNGMAATSALQTGQKIVLYLPAKTPQKASQLTRRKTPAKKSKLARQ